MKAERLLANYEKIADAPDAIARLRRFILDLAVRGKLVQQNATDEPASELLKRIAKEKTRLVKAGMIKNDKPLLPADEDAGFDIPTTWRWTRLGVVTSYIQRGKSPKYAASDGSLVVSQKCVQWRGLDLSVAKQVTIESLTDYEDIRFLRDGDLLWNSTGTGTIGRVIRLIDPPEKLVCDSHVTVVRCLEVDPEYIRTWLRSDHVYALIEDRAAGSTNQVELTGQMAINQVIPLPPLAEQQRIVAKVDELMGLCDRIEAVRQTREATRDKLTAASLAQLNASVPETFQAVSRFALDALPSLTARPDQIKPLRQTILNLAVRGKLVSQDTNDEPASELIKKIESEKARLVKSGKARKSETGDITADEFPYALPEGWTWTRLGSIADWGSGSTPSRSNAALYGGAVTWLKSGELNDNRALKGSEETLTQLAVNKGTFRLNRSGDVLIAMYGATIGKVAILAESAVTNQAVCGCTPFTGTLNQFLFLYLLSQRDQFRAASEGGAQPNISKEKIIWTPFPLPPLAEQHRIVAKADELLGLCDRLEASLVTASETRNRLLQAVLAEALAPAVEHELAAAE